MKFEGTDNYVATEELQMAVNAAVTLQRPLLIKGRARNWQDTACRRSGQIIG